MSGADLTPREREYLDCETPLLSGGKAAGRIFSGILATIAQSLFSPSASYGKAERGLTRTIREITYTKYKKAVLRKQSGTPEKKDKKILIKLNKKEFILAEDTYDPDAFTKQLYEEYMRSHSEHNGPLS